MKRSLSLVLVLLLAWSGAVPMRGDDAPSTHPMKQWMKRQSNAKRKAIFGAMVGAVVGAVTASVRGEDVGKGAVAGAIAGAMAGFAIGRSQDRRIADREAVMRFAAYNPSQGYRASVTEVTAPQTAKQGEQVTVTATFFIIGPDPSEKLTVSRYAGIALPGDLPAEQKYAGVKSVPPDPLLVAQAAGMWRSTFTVAIPPKLPPGTYEIEILVANDARGVAESRAMTIAVVS